MAKKSTRTARRSADTDDHTLNVADHTLVPTHEKCTEAEKKRILAMYDVTLVQLPRILSTDAAIRHLGVQTGDLIRISRSSPTAGTTTFYRIVTTE